MQSNLNRLTARASLLSNSSSALFGLSATASSNRQHALSYENMNPNIKAMEYAVRGPVVLRSIEIERELAQGRSYPFKNVIKATIGDAHAMGQKPITFTRQVIACVTHPRDSDLSAFPSDVRDRARQILDYCDGGSIGAYSSTTGIEVIRKHVADFIAKRDGGIPSNWEDVVLADGASEAIRNVLKMFINRVDDGIKKSGIMIPIPQYPLYSTSIEEFGLGQVGYYLDESNDWALNIAELERSFAEAQEKLDVKVLVVINPGNPTGQVLSRQNIEEIIKFAYEKRLFLFADEVYQENIYAKDAALHSFKKVLMELGEPYASSVELASFHSSSKGYTGECGLRGGYVEFVNLDPKVYVEFIKLTSVKIYSVLGQVAMDCVVNPPQKGDPSYELWNEEKTRILASLKERAGMVSDAFNMFDGITCNFVNGAMYAFPRLHLSKKAVEKAKSLNVAPDFFYAKRLLEETGVCVVPGSTFGQREGTHHFRTTILPQVDQMHEMLKRFKQFNEKFMKEHSVFN